MEGTRNEKVLLIATSYIIGFVTAFIAFGVNNPHTEVTTLSLNVSNANPRVALAENSDESTKEALKITVAQDSDGLFVMNSYAERILSANKNSLQASAVSSLNGTGFYHKIVDAEPSRDGKFVYFCEQLTVDEETCDPYVYSLDEDSLHPVRLNGELYKPTVSRHNSMWIEESVLMLDDSASVTAETPWLLLATAQ
jgi:hypothetical protein